jgi:uncharacterized membrane protein YkvA (DUF1232 family)
MWMFLTDMKNRFFRIALAQATRLAGKPGRMLQLMGQLMHRLYSMDKKHLAVGAFREHLNILGRMMVSYARGRYRAIPVQTLLTILAALLYFMNPFDLVPDALIGVGLTDDFAVLTWVYRAAQEEIDRFIQWETSQPQSKGVVFG